VHQVQKGTELVSIGFIGLYVKVTVNLALGVEPGTQLVVYATRTFGRPSLRSVYIRSKRGQNYFPFSIGFIGLYVKVTVNLALWLGNVN
jgi:hypothetical protein